ncbi:hypothetical protein Vqi01_34530 [Micromonospora qiuiae]|uniref:Uncharacterized protein n=1 Tax=Micromonospora qiuiae TaxID=502268 RepID=A0ABQ4JDM7_9ACTN|nr:hypothetical protein Vqi01_34530 [Micromonospora qiuiae]
MPPSVVGLGSGLPKDGLLAVELPEGALEGRAEPRSGMQFSVPAAGGERQPACWPDTRADPAAYVASD